MPTEIEVANAALVAIGTKTITALTDATTDANVVEIWYPITRDAILRSHPWNFAEKRVQLAQIAGDTPVMDFAYFYQLPADCLKVRRLSDEAVDIAYKVEGDRLLCDDAEVSLLYTFRETNLEAWDPMAIECLIYRLASNIAYPIRQDAGLAKTMFELSAARLADAKATDAQEGTPDVPQCDDLLRVR
jgi:hypothetical protein